MILKAHDFIHNKKIDFNLMLIEDPIPCEWENGCHRKLTDGCENPYFALAMVVKDSKQSKEWNVDLFYVSRFCVYRDDAFEKIEEIEREDEETTS